MVAPFSKFYVKTWVGFCLTLDNEFQFVNGGSVSEALVKENKNH